MSNHKKTFYGITTIGERGQAVIPSEARKKMRLKKGDKLIVFSVHDDMLIFAKASQLEKLVKHLSRKVKSFQQIIEESK